MKCSIDNECPRAASHLKNKAKKNAIIEEKCAQIEAENRLLLEKMSHIMRVRLLLNGARRLTCVAYHLTHTIALSFRRRQKAALIAQTTVSTIPTH